ncbi:MAG: hypothetical protein V4676_08190, partial [Bacteroidota bacterium]
MALPETKDRVLPYLNVRITRENTQMTNPKLLLLWVCVGCTLFTAAQRNYAPASVLASGNWYKLSVDAPGIYKIDLALLNAMGITGNIPAAQIKMFGNGGAMLSEGGNSKPTDDLEESAILVIDGGDGLLNGADYVLFFAPGPHQWQTNLATRKFSHTKNLYSDKAFYYLTIGGVGKRITNQPLQSGLTTFVTSFDERYFHELDSVNFLSSGREWFGEEFSAAPGKTLAKSFAVPLSDVVPGSATIISSVVARSINTASRFSVSINNQFIQQLAVP